MKTRFVPDHDGRGHKERRNVHEQAFAILDQDKTRIRYNDEWLAPLTFEDLIHLSSHFTVQQFLSRESFRQRFDNEGSDLCTRVYVRTDAVLRRLLAEDRRSNRGHGTNSLTSSPLPAS